MSDGFPRLRVREVLIRHKRGPAYLCKPHMGGWKCGRCLRGWVRPYRREKCAVCKSIVSNVITEVRT